ncbi:splicing factor 45-like [Oppia nitens]|uniref:splicing factor 45-like n=1 Tax=Oppia nitens TaxID=1686743 RepID=UPI0023DC1DF2|nr:splicing factor 45-like [Oppia nitens]
MSTKLMSLYDDLLIDDHKRDDSDGWSSSDSRRLLAQHLQNRKTQQNKSKTNKTLIPTKKAEDSTPVITAINISSYKDSKGALLGGEWDVSQEYDPIWANDYEKLRNERQKHDKSRRRDRQPSGRPLGLDYGDDSDEETNNKDERRGGATIAPPPSLIEHSANSDNNSANFGSIAAKIMARMGYREGQGLGREEQGMSSALSVEKTSKRGGKIISDVSQTLMPPPPPPSTTESITEIMKNPSKVVLLRNMVGGGEVDELLEEETKEECGKYGEVISCVIFEMPVGVAEDEAVRIFVEFRRVESAIKAVVDLNGRYFGGRVVKANFFDVEKFKKSELKD